MQGTLSRATLGRLPMYLRYIRRTNTDKISATQIAKGLGLGEVQVRKDLASVCAEGLPKVGYPVSALRRDMERALGVNVPVSAVIVGAGRLGSALMEYDGFLEYGMEIIAAFDLKAQVPPVYKGHVPVYPMEQLAGFCEVHGVRTGILTVPAGAAQEAAEEMVRSGLHAILNFAPVRIHVPEDVTVHHENMALSLAYLHVAAGESHKQEEEEQYGNPDF